MSGKNFLSKLVHYRTYAKYLQSESRREAKYETIERNMQMHIDRFPQLSDDIIQVYEYVHNGLILPSMRSMQFAGEAIARRHQRQYNCSYVQIDHIKAFSDLFMMSMSGCGVGYSVRKVHTSCLPTISCGVADLPIKYISDDAEGWAETIPLLFENPKLEFDYSLIRSEGSPLSTGGTASGPAALEKAHNLIRGVLKAAAGRKLRPFEVHRICCLIADCVVVGGVRRAALIALFDYDDTEMLTCKSGDWYSRNPEFSRANISAVIYKHDPDIDYKIRVVMETCFFGQQGEPGLLLSNTEDMGVNPCAEIGLVNCGVCNVSEVVAPKCSSRAEFIMAVKAAAALGTLQASYTEFRGVRPIWQRTAEAEALLGVSITGQAENQRLLDATTLKSGAYEAIDENIEWAEALGINKSARITTVKPSGTASLWAGCTAGIHAGYSSQYLRRVRVDKGTAIGEALFKHFEEFVVFDPENTNNIIVQVPVRLEPNTLVRSQETAIAALNRTKYIYNNWILPGHVSGRNTHNPSCTISYKTEEQEDIIKWLINNKESYFGVSFIPNSDTNYKYMPFKELDNETFELVNNRFNRLADDFNFNSVLEYKDFTDMKSEAACAGGCCLIAAD
jgi:ribonucleoside-triphosphate reductase